MFRPSIAGRRLRRLGYLRRRFATAPGRSTRQSLRSLFVPQSPGAASGGLFAHGQEQSLDPGQMMDPQEKPDGGGKKGGQKKGSALASSSSAAAALTKPELVDALLAAELASVAALVGAGAVNAKSAL